ncbi:VWA domain-containing protein [bacterium]|nr:VWA domain-containing protein [bacterium]
MINVNYQFNNSIFPVNTKGDIDLLISFQPTTTPKKRRKLNISLVIDRSGSMAGNSLKHALDAAKSVVDSLTDEDIVSVVVFDDVIKTIVPPQNPTDKKAIKQTISSVRAGGITDLHGGWAEGCKHVEQNFDPLAINRVLLLTDGQMNSGITDKKTIISKVVQKGDAGVVTTTLGFGSWFEEDLLTSMAASSNGNFYFIQTKEDATEVFQLELDSLKSVIAQNLVLKLSPADNITLTQWLNLSKDDKQSQKLKMNFGSIFENEDKLIGLKINTPTFDKEGVFPLFSVKYSTETVDDSGNIQKIEGDLDVNITIGNGQATLTSAYVDIARLKIAQAKNSALKFADAGNYTEASTALKSLATELETQGLHEHFEMAEEIEQLQYFATRFSNKNVSSDTRKELKDQSFQGLSRNRKDLAARGTEISQEVSKMPTVSEVGEGVELVCVKEGGKLRIKVASSGYDQTLNVQFPRAIRADGAKYVVEKLVLSSNGSFYRADGKIQRLVKEGEVDIFKSSSGSSRVKTGKASSAPKTLADLEVTDSVGDGILVQCVKAGSKLRARVVSDGYEPDWNMRFPRSIREEGTLYVVDEVITGPDGKSYIACGKIKRFEQA